LPNSDKETAHNLHIYRTIGHPSAPTDFLGGGCPGDSKHTKALVPKNEKISIL